MEWCIRASFQKGNPKGEMQSSQPQSQPQADIPSLQALMNSAAHWGVVSGGVVGRQNVTSQAAQKVSDIGLVSVQYQNETHCGPSLICTVMGAAPTEEIAGYEV